MKALLKRAAARDLKRATEHVARKEQLASGNRLSNLIEASMRTTRRQDALQKAERESFRPSRKHRIAHIRQRLYVRQQRLGKDVEAERGARRAYLEHPHRVAFQKETPLPPSQDVPKGEAKATKKGLPVTALGLGALGTTTTGYLGGRHAHRHKDKDTAMHRPLKKVAATTGLAGAGNKTAAPVDLSAAQGIGRLGQLLTGSHGRALSDAAARATSRAGAVGKPGVLHGTLRAAGRRQKELHSALEGRAAKMQQAAGSEQKAVRNARLAVGGGAALTGGTYLAARSGAKRGVNQAFAPSEEKLAAAVKIALRSAKDEAKAKRDSWAKSEFMRRGRNAATAEGAIPAAALAGTAALTAKGIGNYLSEGKGKLTNPHVAGAALAGAAAGALHKRLKFNAGEAKKDIAAVRALAKERESRRMRQQEKVAGVDAALTDEMLVALYGV